MTSPDFEVPADANGDNVYDIVVTASDGVNTTDQAVAVAVTNVNDVAPLITSSATATFAENATGVVYAATATDAEGDAVSFSLSGADAARFGIDAATGGVIEALSMRNGCGIAADGYGNDLIHTFTKDGEYVKSFGGREAPYGFKTCHKLAIDTRFDPPQLLCCDREHRRMVRLTLDGEVLGEIAEMRRPAAVVIHGDYAIVGEIEGRVSVLDKEGNRVSTLGSNETPGEFATNKVEPPKWRTGIFNAPHGVAVDAAGDLYVAEYSIHGRILKFDNVSN